MIDGDTSMLTERELRDPIREHAERNAVPGVTAGLSRDGVVVITHHGLADVTTRQTAATPLDDRTFRVVPPDPDSRTVTFGAFDAEGLGLNRSTNDLDPDTP